MKQISLQDRMRDAALTPAERRVAEVVLRDPERVAFGTVAEIAALARTGGASVMRLAAKIGFEGFSDLQAEARAELTRRLRPAAARARLPLADNPIAHAVQTEIANVRGTLDALDRRSLARAAKLVARARRVAVLAGNDAGSSAVGVFATDLSMIRPDVHLVSGSSLGLVRGLAWLGKGDLLIVLDVPRYERAVVDAATELRERAVDVLAISDSHVSPIGRMATVSLTAVTTGVSAFESYVGVLALVNTVVAAVAAVLGASATAHLDRLEAAWLARGELIDE